MKLEEEDGHTVAKEGEQAVGGDMAEDGFVSLSRFYWSLWWNEGMDLRFWEVGRQTFLISRSYL